MELFSKMGILGGAWEAAGLCDCGWNKVLFLVMTKCEFVKSVKGYAVFYGSI